MQVFKVARNIMKYLWNSWNIASAIDELSPGGSEHDQLRLNSLYDAQS